MNDREQFLATKAEREGSMSGGGVYEPPNIEAIQKALIEKAQATRFYFDMLVDVGFNGEQALAIVINTNL